MKSEEGIMLTHWSRTKQNHQRKERKTTTYDTISSENDVEQ